jgi:predicted PurR-regulated permease PerM
MRPLPATVYREQSIGPAAGQSVVNGLIIFLALCSMLYFGSEILIPVAFAILLAILLSPVVTFLQRLRLPKPVAVISTVVMAVIIIAGLTAVVASTLTTLANDLPRYESSLREKAQNIKQMATGGGTLERAANVLEDLQVELQGSKTPGAATSGPVSPIPVEIQESNWGPFSSIATVLGVVVHPLTQIGIIILMLTFILFYREDLRNRLIRLAGTGDIHRTTTALDEAGTRLSRLYATQLLINGATGLFLGAALFIIGVPGAILWGVLTAILRFVPYVGTLMASIFPIIIALAVSDGWTLALMTAGIVLVTEAVIGQIIEPLFFGKSTGVSPVAVVVAAAFWTALWGPIGLVLSTPITIMLLVVGRNIEALQFLEVMLGSSPVLTADHAFYQRMLASDPIEAAETAETYESDNKLDVYLTEVAVPGLLLAQHDKDRRVLTPEREVSVATTFSQLLEDLWPAADSKIDSTAPVALVSAHGALNFAATLAVSALLRLKKIPHRLFPPDSIAPGKFPKDAASGVETICLCYLTAPSAAKYSYLAKRVSAQLPDAKIIGVAWQSMDNGHSMISPEHVAAMLPNANRSQTEQSEAPSAALPAAAE